MIGWDAAGFKSAVSIVGTLNDPTDTDKNWNVEIAIPFASLKMGLKNPVPSDGRQWKINFSRVEWQSVIVDGKYQKKKDEKTGRDLSENNWVWNPTGEINMHVPERWGLAQFSTKTVSSEKVAFQLSDQEALRKIVWMVYYKQQDFKKTHGHFSLSLSDLKVPAVMNVSSGKTARIKLSAATNRFTVLLTTKEGLYLSLDENGLIQNGHHKN